MNKFNLLLAVGLLAVLSSCGPTLTPFTQRLYEQNNWNEEDLKQIQFYLSQDLVLRRVASRGTTNIEKGEIEMVEGGEIEKIRIARGTPGIMVFSPKENRFAVSFDEADDLYLMFGPNPKAGNRYVVLASDWDRKKGKISYGGKQYVVDSDAAYASLMVDMKRVRRVDVKSRQARGRVID